MQASFPRALLPRLMFLLLLQVFLYSALVNMWDADRTAYPTAEYPGAQPVSLQEFNASRKRAQAALLPQCEPQHCSSSHRQLRSGGMRTIHARLCQSIEGVYHWSSPLPIDMLHLTTRLAPSVFLGGCVLPICFPAVCHLCILQPELDHTVRHIFTSHTTCLHSDSPVRCL